MRDTEQSLLEPVLTTFLTERCGLAQPQRVRFAALVATLLTAVRGGHSCIAVAEEDRAVLAASRIVSSGAPAPLVLSGARLYLHRFYHYEKRLADILQILAERSAAAEQPALLLDEWFPATDAQPDLQREAARMALSGRLTIITGGPGTGKTTTVARIVGLLLVCCGASLKITLAAPTGKAAVRLQESLQQHLPGLPLSKELKEAFPDRAQTVHRLLGVRRHATRFVHTGDNPLPWDVVIVDEASMVDLALMCKLVEALRDGSRLILLGDKDQLSSVESGAVLGDCVRSLPQRVVALQRSYRFQRRLADFAAAVNDGAAAQAVELIDRPESPVSRGDENWQLLLETAYGRYLTAVATATSIAAYPELFALFARFRVLCALRHGPRGAAGFNERIERLLAGSGMIPAGHGWYPGRPVIITRNDYALGLYNGDIGLCLPDPQRGGEAAVWFERRGELPRSLLPVQLPALETAWAMTVHKSQGSEFDQVVIVLPEAPNRILSRELLYTAVTRARKRVILLADDEALTAAIDRPTVRCSGLAERLLAQ
ncbi:exodeoxyribonuclease V subunit alpha [Desulfofustis glycolicus]|uniref:DNA helicase/exodeoxyribonuclease V, alpha subunit n=1 Tax=Desulfofustis glycolicus DSM 9705 TaxID=1121409 RepID=A0A1M5VUP5_9BACT|nr:exodeoxyribonuclease V subunit alpha [Desulfofustis glycolicus]SHH78985.1 DNA helicase/exodeoxyribonuclease V, alpha subunit [Desulfofustis glycolicus DSM 9705]